MRQPNRIVFGLICLISQFMGNSLAGESSPQDARNHIKLIEGKLAEIDALQAELDEMRHRLGMEKFLSVSFTEIELDFAKFKFRTFSGRIFTRPRGRAGVAGGVVGAVAPGFRGQAGV